MERYRGDSGGAAGYWSPGIVFAEQRHGHAVRSHVVPTESSVRGAWREIPGNAMSTPPRGCPAASADQQAAAVNEPGLHEVRWLPEWKNQTYEPSTSYLVHSRSSAALVPEYRTSSPIRRPSSVGLSKRIPQAATNDRIQARSANTAAQRRSGRPQQLLLQPKGRKEKKVGTFASTLGAESSSRPDGQHTGLRGTGALPCSVSDGNAISNNIPYLQKRRTWLLLQYLVGQLEQKGHADRSQSEALLQHPEALQQLLQPLMPLLPLKEMLDQLLKKEETTSSVLHNVSGSGPHQEAAGRRVGLPPRAAQHPPSGPRSQSVYRLGASASLGTRAEPLSSPNVHRATRLLRSAPSPSRWGSAAAGRGIEHTQLARCNAVHPGIRGTRTSSVHPNLSSQGPGERGAEHICPLQGRRPSQDGLVRPAGTMGQPDLPQWSEKLLVGRPVSTGRNVRPKAHVASRLPPGALEHRRLLKARTRAGSLEKYFAERPHLVSLKDWDKSPSHHGVSETEPAVSARSADSGDTLKLGPTPSSGHVLPDSIEGGGRWPVDISSGSARWAAIGLRPDPCFNSIRVLGALPPSPPPGDADEGETAHSPPSGHPPLQRSGSPTSTEERQVAEAGIELPASPRVRPRPASQGPGHRLTEPRQSPTRRQTAASPSSSPSTAERDGLLRRQQPIQEGIHASPARRERHLTVAEAMKRRGMSVASKVGRIVPAGEESDRETPRGPGASRLPRLKEMTRVKEGRRTTTQVSTPRSTPFLSPRRPTSAKSKPERPPIHGKVLAKKDSKTSLKSPRASPRELVPGAVGGRRLSAPPPRRATQAKLAPVTPPRARPGVSAATATRLGSLPVKSIPGRRKTVKISPAKPKAKRAESPKGQEPLPEAELTAPKEEELGKSEEALTPMEPPPEPPYPFLRLTELPVLEAPIRPLPNLKALPLKASPDPPPPIDDTVTFMHVLERSERMTETARDKATHHAVSCLCNDGPGTMLLVARWMDTAADTVESNSITVKEELPWRDVIPPLFVGLNTHRELLSPRMPRNPLMLKEIRDFLESEGFIETQEQRLRHLLAHKGVTSKPFVGLAAPITPTPLDIYLDYILEVAIAFLRLRQQPVVLPKITRFAVGAGEETRSSSCYSDSCCPSDRSLDSVDASACSGDGCGGRRETPRRRDFGPRGSIESSCSQRRCWSCLPIRGPPLERCCCRARSWYSQETTASMGCGGSSCCTFASVRGPPELDLYQSTAAQQIRATVSRMPLLPSEKYLRYLRLAGRRSELTALAIWLAGRPDLVPSYDEYMALKERHEAAATLKKPSTEQDEQMSSPSPSSPVSISSSESSSHPSSGDIQKAQTAGEGTAAQRTISRMGETQEQHKDKDDGESQGSSLVVSLYSSPRSPDQQAAVATSSSARSIADSGVEPSHTRLEEDKPAELSADVGSSMLPPIRVLELGRVVGKQRIAAAPTKAQGSGGLPSLAGSRALPWGRPKDPPEARKSTFAGPAPPHHLRTVSVATAKAKAKKDFAAKSPAPRGAATSEKTAAGGRPKGQLQAPPVPGHVTFARDPQRAAMVRLEKADDPSVAHRPQSEPSESVGIAAVVTPKPAKTEPRATNTLDQSIRSYPQMSRDPGPLVFPHGRRGNPARQSRGDHPTNQGLLHEHVRSVPPRGSSSKRFYMPQRLPRYPAAAPQPKRSSGTRPGEWVTGPPGYAEQLTREAVDLLSEPQMLAEVASLCARLSALVCCTETAPPAEQATEFAPDSNERLELTGASR